MNSTNNTELQVYIADIKDRAWRCQASGQEEKARFLKAFAAELTNSGHIDATTGRQCAHRARAAGNQGQYDVAVLWSGLASEIEAIWGGLAS